MSNIIGLIGLFVVVGSLYVGLVTICAFFTEKKEKDIITRTEICRNPKMLIVSIVLLVLTPVYFFYTVISHRIPDGEYPMYADYRVVSYEPEYSHSGIAPITIEIHNDTEYYENGEDYYGRTKWGVHHYLYVYLRSVKLDCLNNKTLYFDREISGNSEYDFDIDEDNFSGTLFLAIGEISDETLGYTIEDRFNDISLRSAIEYSILWIFDIIAIIGYFKAEKNKETQRIRRRLTKRQLFCLPQAWVCTLRGRVWARGAEGG